MTHVLLCLQLVAGAADAQITPPPLLSDAPPAAAEAPALLAPPDPAFIEAVDRQLLFFRQEWGGVRLANREESLGVGTLFLDSELDPMFAAVPAAAALFKEAREKAFIASLLTLGGIVGLAGSLAMAVAVVAAPQLSLVLLVVALALDVAALVVTIVSLPFRIRSQALLYEAVEVHNRGLLRLPVAAPRSDAVAPSPGVLLARF